MTGKPKTELDKWLPGLGVWGQMAGGDRSWGDDDLKLVAVRVAQVCEHRTLNGEPHRL